MDELQRSLMTIGCRDCDPLPRVAGAGRTFDRDGRRVQRMYNGIEVIHGGYYGEWMAHVIRGLDGHHEPQEELLFHHLLRYVRNDSLMVELGCFWCYYGCSYLAAVPGSRLVGIEPDPAHLAVGRDNLALNGLTDRAELHLGWIGGEARAQHDGPSETGVPTGWPMFDAAAIAALAGRPVELLHVDIQGAELPLLDSMQALDPRQAFRFVLMSTHHHSISGSRHTHEDCLVRLRALGAVILEEHDVGESFSGDGLILASFRADDATLAFPAISRNRAEASLFGGR